MPLLTIHSNKSLVDLGALIGIEALDGISIDKNISLKSLEGLNNLQQINRIGISENSTLKNYCALTNAILNSLSIEAYAVNNNFFNPSLNNFDIGNCSF